MKKVMCFLALILIVAAALPGIAFADETEPTPTVSPTESPEPVMLEEETAGKRSSGR